MTPTGSGVSLWGDESVLGWIMVIVAQLCEIAKNLLNFIILKGEFYGMRITFQLKKQESSPSLFSKAQLVQGGHIYQHIFIYLCFQKCQ